MDKSEIAASLRRLRDKRLALMAEVAAVDEDRANVVAAGFDAGMSNSAMMEDSGLSQQRLSQLYRGGVKGRQ